MPLLVATNLSKTYRLGRNNYVKALRGINISVNAGEMIAIMGPSGCGKSTLMHILGLLHAPDSDARADAHVIIDNREMTLLSDRERTKMRAQTIGFIFQSFNLIPTLTALENVALAVEYAGKSRASAILAARNALDWVGLSDRSDHRPNELSGGEQQRVTIARALVNEPSILLADEPTGNLDSVSTTEILNILHRFNEQHGQTIIIVTHDPEVGASCQRIVKMRDGVLDVVGSSER